jgi:sodium/potassium/calcium exchanger 6
LEAHHHGHTHHGHSDEKLAGWGKLDCALVGEWLATFSNWAEKGTLARLAYPLELVFILARDLTIPNLDEHAWRRLTCALATLGAPVVGMLLFRPHAAHIELGGSFPLPLLVFLLTLPLALLAYKTTRDEEPPEGTTGLLLLLLGFTSAVTWTNAIANELVAALSMLGTLLGISPAVLGLTVLAWGNSVGDFVADTALARSGNPRMGAASCFGSPIFNLCVGFGLSLTVAISKNGRPFELPKDDDVPLALTFLVGSCLLTGVGVPLTGFRLGGKYGACLIGYYALFILLALLCEEKVLRL